MSRRYYHPKNDDDITDSIFVLVVVIVLALVGAAVSARTIGALIEDIVVLLVLALGCLVVFGLLHRRAQTRLHALNMVDIAKMSGTDFEKYVAELLKSKGYSQVTLTEYYDLGIDITAKKDGIRWGIQVKRYSSPVRADAVR